MVYLSKRFGVALISLLFVAGFLLLFQSGIYSGILATNHPTAWGYNPTPAATPPPLKATSVHSPDGTMKVDMRQVSEVSGSVTYSVFTSLVGGANQHILYVATPPSGATITIPANSWSPDNAFVFIKSQTSLGMTFFVFHADGSVFGDTTKYIDVGVLFKDQLPDLVLTDVTGWDSQNLLHVFTSAKDGTRGSSYWFDVDSSTFIELANY